MLTKDEKIQWRKKMRKLDRRQQAGRGIQKHEAELLQELNFKQSPFLEKIKILLQMFFRSISSFFKKRLLRIKRHFS